MTTPTIDHPSDQPSRTGSSTDRRGWDRLLILSAAVVALADVIFFALIAEVIPPLAVGAVLTLIGIGVHRRWRIPGIIVLALTTLVMLTGTPEFAVDHFGHPNSGIDWLHAVVGTFGRIFVLGVAVAAWRARSDAAARLTGVVALGLLGAAATLALVATAVTSGDDRQAGDVVVTIDSTAFPERIVVESGGVLYLDNEHIFRHSFTVEGTDIDVGLPALQGVRIPIDLPAGTYEVFCDVPGHDDMTTVMVVE